MKRSLGYCAIALGSIGVVLCCAAIAFGWWTSARTVDRVDRGAARLDEGLSEADVRLARVESRVSTVRAELRDIRVGAEAILADNPELPRVRAEIERLIARLGPALDRVDATADSLRTVSAGLRAAADLVDQLNDEPEATVRVRAAADAIDRAAEVLGAPRAKIDAVKSAKAVELVRNLVELARQAIAGSELLAEGLAAARQELTIARQRTAEYREAIVFRIRVAAVVNMLFWLWGGVGQLCLIVWGRNRAGRASESRREVANRT